MYFKCLPKLFVVDLFILYAGVHICTICVCLGPAEVRRGHHRPETGGTHADDSPVGAGNRTKFPAKAASALN